MQVQQLTPQMMQKAFLKANPGFKGPAPMPGAGNPPPPPGMPQYAPLDPTLPDNQQRITPLDPSQQMPQQQMQQPMMGGMGLANPYAMGPGGRMYESAMDMQAAPSQPMGNAFSQSNPAQGMGMGARGMGGAQPAPVARKSGGRLTAKASSYKDMTAGSGGGEGRLQKTDIATKHKDAPAFKKGGKVYRSYKDMDAGSGSGLGRLEKTEIQSRKR
jgi:hypothetical protein